MQNVLSSWINKVHSLHVTLINNYYFFLSVIELTPILLMKHDKLRIESKQQQRRRLRKRHLKRECTLPQTLSRLFHLV